MEHNPPHHTESLETCIRHRHSIRFFKSDAVPISTLESCLALAQLAPSNSNMQNWRLTVATGAARDRVVEALWSEASKHGPEAIPALPDEFKHYRSEFGHELYGERGYNIPRTDKEAAAAAKMRNFRFFDAPVVAVIHMQKNLSMVDSMSVGMFIQTFMLALTEQGLGACLQVSVTGFQELLKTECGIADDQMVLCGMAIGWPAEHNPVNTLVIPRDALGQQVSFITD